MLGLLKKSLISMALAVSSSIYADVNTAMTQNSGAIVKTEKQYQWTTVPTQFISADGVSFAYREYGQQNGGTPVIFLNHLAAVLDNWDPRIIDGIAAKHHIVILDNRGVGARAARRLCPARGCGAAATRAVSTQPIEPKRIVCPRPTSTCTSPPKADCSRNWRPACVSRSRTAATTGCP